MGTGETRYETKTIKALRGVEGRTVDKWQAQGWEVVSRSPGKVQTEITLRRPIRTINPKLYVIGGVAAVIAIAVVVSVSALTHHSTSTAPSASPTHQVATSPSTSGTSAPSSASSTSSASANAVDQSATAPAPTKMLTAANSPELAAVLAQHDNCDASLDAFARKHAGETIAFDGNIASLQRHGDTKTRYDLLIGVGDYSTSTEIGPTFQFRDVNLTSDLHLTGGDPGALGAGDNVHVVATVDQFMPASCLFFLKPVTTSMR